MATDYVSVTEVSGDGVTEEQVQRLARRYYWALDFCSGKDVLEVGCGAGQGAGILASVAKSFVGGDVSVPLLDLARSHYGDRIDFRHLDALELAVPDASFDIIAIFEALYYVPDLDRFFAECRRVLRPGGKLLIVTANKDLYDFNPSEHSYRYLGVPELSLELGKRGFEVHLYGDTPVNTVSLRQRILRPVKAAASRLGLIPNSMQAKKLLKRFVFGGLVHMPSEITNETALNQAPTPLDPTKPDTTHKVIYCAACLV